MGVIPYSYETNELICNKYLMGMQAKKLRFILEKLGSKMTFILSEIWNLANLFETVKSTVSLKNTIPQDGYTLFSRKESGRNPEICEIGEKVALQQVRIANQMKTQMNSKII